MIIVVNMVGGPVTHRARSLIESYDAVGNFQLLLSLEDGSEIAVDADDIASIHIEHS
jgi:hypothetical protein